MGFWDGGILVLFAGILKLLHLLGVFFVKK